MRAQNGDAISTHEPGSDKATDAEKLTNSIGMELVRIPAGEFDMGITQEQQRYYDNVTSRRVRISRPFYIGATEVTRGQFAAFVKSTNYKTDCERNEKGGEGYNLSKRLRESGGFVYFIASLYDRISCHARN